MQRKIAKKKAWRPKCAAPRLVYDSTLFFETFMHVRVYVGTTYDQIYSMKEKKKKKPPEVRSRDGYMYNMCAKLQGLSLKNGADIRAFVRKTSAFYVVACTVCNYLV